MPESPLLREVAAMAPVTQADVHPPVDVLPAVAPVVVVAVDAEAAAVDHAKWQKSFSQNTYP